MAGERIDRVLQEDSTVMSSLSDNSLELCKKAIKGWDARTTIYCSKDFRTMGDLDDSLHHLQ